MRTLLNCLADAKCYTKFDIIAAYNILCVQAGCNELINHYQIGRYGLIAMYEDNKTKKIRFSRVIL